MNNNRHNVLQPLTVPHALELANAHWNAGQAQQAEQLCLRVLNAQPRQPDALNLLGLMMHAYGKLDLAIDYMQKACQAVDAQAVCQSNLAELYRQKGLLREAEQAARKAVEQDPQLLAAWSNLGIILQESGKFSASLDCLKFVASMQPSNAEVYNNLANTYMRQGDLRRSEENYQRALALRPDYAEVHSNLAFLLNDLGRFDEAMASARRAIEINPQLADAYFNLAQIELTRMRYADAYQWIRSLLSFSPQHVGGLTALAHLMIIDERYQEAVDNARKALALAPDNANAHKTLGKALQALGHYEEAEQAYDRAAALPGTVAEEALIARAAMFMEVGDKEAATAGFEQALQRFPRSARIIAARCDTKSYCVGDPDVEILEAALTREPKPPLHEQMMLHFSLGKVSLDIGDSKRAFFHLNRGNAIKRASFNYDAGHVSAWVRSIAEVFTSELMDHFSGSGVASERPVFIVGMPRSGTTLVEQILASHPSVYGAGELRTLSQAVAHGGRFPDDLALWSKADLARIGEDYLERLNRLAPDALRVIDKQPGNFLYAGLIPLLLPGARIIHCRRDPVDTCLSCYSKNFSSAQLFSYQLDELGRFHLDYQELMAKLTLVIPAGNFIEVDYETVVDDLEGQARRLIDFLGLPWDDACLTFHQAQRVVKTASVAHVRQPIYQTSKGRWRKHAEELAPLLDALKIAP